MNHSMLLLLAAATFACTIGLCRAGVYKDLAQCTTEEVEKCGVDFVPYFGGNTLAVNAADLEKQCTKYQSQLKCSDDFSVKCLEGLPKGTILLMLRAARDEYDAICNVTSPRHQEYLKNVGCINKAGPVLTSCMNTLFVGLHRSAAKAADRLKVPYTCCYYADFVNCASSGLKTKCGEKDAEAFFDTIIQHVFGEVLDLACGKYRAGSESCKSLTPLPTADDARAKDKGFIEPLTVIASKLG